MRNNLPILNNTNQNNVKTSKAGNATGEKSPLTHLTYIRINTDRKNQNFILATRE